jgi:hypothetical protein
VHQKQPPPRVAVSVCAALLAKVIIVAVKISKYLFMNDEQFTQKNSAEQKMLKVSGKTLPEHRNYWQNYIS